MEPDILKALESFARFLVQTFGPNGTVLLLLGVAALLFAWRAYAQRQQEQALEDLKRVYEDRIRMLEARESHRQRLELLERGMNTAEIDAILGPAPAATSFAPVPLEALPLLGFIRRKRALAEPKE